MNLSQEGARVLMPSLTLELNPNGEQHKFLVSQLSSRVKYAELGRQRTKVEENWRQAENSVLAYVPEDELDAKRRAKRENEGEPRYTTIKIPYSYSLLMAGHTSWP